MPRSRGIRLIEPTQLYNLLNQHTTYPCLSDPVFMLLLDARDDSEYEETHVITAKRVRKNRSDEYIVPYEADLECKTHVIVYDGNTTSLDVDRGYEEFSALYPFLRTIKIIYMPRELDAIETYPAEIIPARLYLGNLADGNSPHKLKDLKIKGRVVCGSDIIPNFSKNDNILLLNAKDDEFSSFKSSFKPAVQFIDKYINRNEAVLVFSQHSVSRSVTFVMAYLIHCNKYSVDEAFKAVRDCHPMACPNQNFLRELTDWAEHVVNRAEGSLSDESDQEINEGVGEREERGEEEEGRDEEGGEEEEENEEEEPFDEQMFLGGNIPALDDDASKALHSTEHHHDRHRHDAPDSGHDENDDKESVTSEVELTGNEEDTTQEEQS